MYNAYVDNQSILYKDTLAKAIGSPVPDSASGKLQARFFGVASLDAL
jgi:hypothetical protein